METGSRTGQVCRHCLQENPQDISLITYKCKNESHGHSIRVWVQLNNFTGQLEEVPAPQRIRPKPQVNLPKGKRFMLCDGGTRCRGERCTFPHSKEERDEWNRQLNEENWITLPQDVWQWGNTTTAALSQQHSPRYRSDPTTPLANSAPIKEASPVVDWGSQELETELEPQELETKLEPQELETELESQVETITHQLQAEHNEEASAVLYAPLSLDNYRDKFEKLVQAEEGAHEGKLSERCNGSCFLTFAGRNCPRGLNVKNQRVAEQYVWYAYLDGLSIDNLSYINLASDKVTIAGRNNRPLDADIYRLVHPNRLVAAFKMDYSKLLNNKANVKVNFLLKRSYFKDLREAVRSLSPLVVSRLLPTQDLFHGLPSCFPDIKEFAEYFSEEQVAALCTISALAHRSPPLLLNGAFGTGKSRLLALSTRFFQSVGNPIRILVCTQQRVSADKFLEYYLDCAEPYIGSVFVIRDYALHQVNSELMEYYIMTKQFRMKNKQERFDNIVLITTCLTAPHLKFLGAGYFTHILIDECSQMREPEAIAPLCLAGADTKLIFAGDQNQVGPALLVLGDTAQRNGLSVSLLQRLLQHYQSLGECATRNIVTLSENYRCHKDILNLVDGLFYRCGLSYVNDVSLPITHRDYKYPLAFICSGISKNFSLDAEIYQKEAEIIAGTVLKVFRSSPPGWPKPFMSHLFIVSPSEEQVARVNKMFRDKFPKHSFESLPDVKSTTNIQGRECQAVFLSTLEEVHDDGSTRNPTRSLCDPYVFNTAVTRARSLVIAVGNPFFLLRMEQQVVRLHGKRGNCWSTFLKNCIEKGTLTLPKELPEAQKKELILELQKSIEQLDPDSIISERDFLREELDAVKSKHDALHEELHAAKSKHDAELDAAKSKHDALHEENKKLQALISTLQQLPAAVPYPQGMQHPLQGSPREDPSHLNHSQGMAVFDPPELQRRPSQCEPSPSLGLYPQQSSHPLRVSQSPIHEAANSSQHESELSPSDYHSIPDHSHSNTDIQRMTPTQELFQDRWSPRRDQSGAGQSHGQMARKFQREHTLGFGTFGVVHHVKEKLTGAEYALKVIKLQQDEARDHKKWREVEALSTLKYGGIVEYIDSCEEMVSSEWYSCDQKGKEAEPRMCLFIVMELCERDTLKQWLLKNRGENSRNKKAMINYFEQILDALCFIHENNFIHRDLKPSNIFFSRENEDTLKVGDFGLVSFNEPQDTSDEHGNMQRQATGSSNRGAGTFPYISPEQIDPARRKKLDEKTDMYALGIILFELHYPKEVDDEERLEVLSKVRSRVFPGGFKDKMSKVYTVARLLTETAATRRPTSRGLKEMNEFTELKKLNKKAKRSFVPVL